MNQRRIFSIVALAILMFSLVFGGNIPAAAQTPQPPPPQGQGKDKQPRITQKDRQAAADRAADAGLALPEVGAAAMAMTGDAPQYFSHPNYANSPLAGNIVAEWNLIAQNIVQPAPMPGMTMSSVSMSEAFVYLSYVQAAVYNALVAIEGGYAPYKSALTAPPDASRDAAVAAAAFNVLANYFPTQLADLTTKYQASLSGVINGASKDAGILVGQQAAAEIIALRAGDGRAATGTYTIPAPAPGVWQPTMQLPDGTFAPPIDPWMAVLVPFTLNAPSQFRPADPRDPASPLNLTSAEYAIQLNEVKEMGSAMSMTRTAQQTEAAQFWATNGVTQFNNAFRDVAAAKGLGLLDSARLLAAGNMVGTDALIACFDSKYTYSFWRPVTAIRMADLDGNDATIADPTWMPLLMTPNHPEYVAGHACFMSAQAEIFSQILGTTNIALDLSSDVTNTTRHFATAADLRTEIVNARTWAGLHYRVSGELGVTLGQNVAQFAFGNFFATAPSLSTHATFSGGIRKFVDTLPGLGAAGANNLGQYISVAVPDTTTYPGSDYYEIAVVEYEKQMHSDLPPTKLRGYVQLETSVITGSHYDLGNGFFSVDPPQYLGATISATKDRPVRILFRNLLPNTASGGNLFLPVDVTVMGAGMAPGGYGMVEADPQNPMCDTADPVMKADMVASGICYAENRATLHLHGGISPWISDGTPHQWITPANEATPYPKGVSVVPVPDMPDAGPGAMTFFYSNQQSARLMFYHDHSWGITRLNVYGGEAAGYLLTDPTEQALVNAGVIPAEQIPLIIQDKTFVPSLTQLAVQDNTWDSARWGDFGDLWLPHVYSPAQNPGDSSGVNQFGRWAYGPWFWPPTVDIENGPIPNPYYCGPDGLMADGITPCMPACDPNVQWCEPPLMPGTPFNSMGMEAFMDTPIVNGTAYPTITLEPKSYRFRILNAANDRFFNLSLYKAVDANGVLCDTANLAPAAEASGVTCTEVALNPAEVLAALTDPAGIFPTPVAGTEGPSWVQIATEGGFLPAPSVIPAQPTTWVTDPTVFNAGNVDKHSLLIAPAERADVIVDFSAFAGQTLILYNDAPAAFPARDPRYDYYTGNPDLTDTGGAPSTQAGYGPNTRTVMRIKIEGAPAPAFNQTALDNAFKAESLGGMGVFKNGQNPIIVGQGAYNTAYNTTFQNNGPDAGLVQIFNTSFSFKTLAGGAAGPSLTFPLQPKMIQDEMGEAFDHEYGRMSGFLGVETANAQAGLQNMILYPYLSPPTEILKGVQVPLSAAGSLVVEPLTTTDDGTQIWKITHNGVDTHPIHFHLYEVQLINRVGWDGIIRKPEANELGWKDTVRISPLEDTIVALRPVLPVVPFDLPNSIRLIDPSMPEGVYIANTTQQEALGLPIFAFNPDGEPVDIINHKVNYGYEYVWHCHILSHEEMDMMHAQVVGVAPKDPTGLTAVRVGNGGNRRVDLAWQDTSLNESSFVIERATKISGPWTVIKTIPSAGNTLGAMTYSDPIGNTNQAYVYRVKAVNTVGDTWDYSNPAFNEIPPGGGFPTLTLPSAYTNLASFVDLTVPAAPSNFTATLVVQRNRTRAALTWTDNATNETGFTIQRAFDAGFTSGVVTYTVGANAITFTTENLQAGTTYYFRIRAFTAVAESNWVVANASAPIVTPLAALDTNLNISFFLPVIQR